MNWTFRRIPGRSRRRGIRARRSPREYLWNTGSADAAQVALTGKVQNVLNRSYEERKDFPAPGINFLLGMEISI